MNLRPELPEPVPQAILDLPVERGYPVPWFVALVDGVYDFRVLKPDAVKDAMRYQLCWICGQPLGAWVTFVVGPMCAVNRTSSEPPSHRECAEWSARACPFLARPHMDRREAGLPEEVQDPSGIMLRRNPGVALCWHTTRALFRERAEAPGLFYIGDPYETTWFAEGREATRDEVRVSIESGLPALQELADAQGGHAPKTLEKYVYRAMQYVPA